MSSKPDARETARIPLGAWAEQRETVTPQRTVGHHYPGFPMVYGTPMMIELMELAAATAIQPYLAEGRISVGAGVSIRHLAATPVGFTVVARAEVTAVDERTVTFRVEAHDGVERIGEGTHLRAPVELARFDRGVGSKLRRRP